MRGSNLTEANDLIEAAITIAGPLPGLLDSRAVVYLAGKHIKEALTDINAAIADTPSAVRYFHKAEVLEADNENTAARQAFQKAEELGLKPEMLHPLERSRYGKLRTAMLPGV